jgi:peptidoglycan/xylan/chitin deacetylase (PgdA/CDA1 family)
MTFLSSVTSMLGHALPTTRANRLLILIYHRVPLQPDPMFPLETCAERFDWQMRMLRRHCSPISLGEGVRRLRAGSLPSRAVAVTFDDGYSDNATVALPILRRHQVPATFFIATGFIDGGRMWNDTVIEAVRRSSGSALDLRSLGLGVEPLGEAAARGALAQKILRTVKHLHPSERRARIESLRAQVGASLPDDLMMTSIQVRGLTEAGMEVGGHTINHPILRTLSEEEATAEIRGNRLRLEQISGMPVTAFAYPNGRPGDDYTNRDRDLVESLGFDHAVSTTLGAATSGSDLFQLPRFGAWDREPERWLARLLLAFGRAR